MTEEILPAKDDDLSVQVPIASFEDTQYWAKQLSQCTTLNKWSILIAIQVIQFLNETRCAIEHQERLCNSIDYTADESEKCIKALETLFGKRPLQSRIEWPGVVPQALEQEAPSVWKDLCMRSGVSQNPNDGVVPGIAFFRLHSSQNMRCTFEVPRLPERNIDALMAEMIACILRCMNTGAVGSVRIIDEATRYAPGIVARFTRTPLTPPTLSPASSPRSGRPPR
jgi:hypothetical protein